MVKVAYEAFARGRLDRFVDHFANDVDYRTVEGAPDDSGPIHGKGTAWVKPRTEPAEEPSPPRVQRRPHERSEASDRLE